MEQLNKFSVGIVGIGYVGGAIKYAYDMNNNVVQTYDINPTLNPTCATLEELVEKTNLIYVCVPTPMTAEGRCNISIVEGVVDAICKLVDDRVLVIKSTILPGTTRYLQQKHPNNTILFSPEFLTEANFANDYLNQDVMLVGYVNNKATAENVLSEQISTVTTVNTPRVVDATLAEFFKYMANTFLATKVSFANEMFNITSAIGIKWEDVVELAYEDPRLGKTHWKVPGPDGKHGWGGTCFPKDMSALINQANQMNIDTPLLNAAWKRNLETDRVERDWELLINRAVS
jgi:nucleotide sugar dehydrogenase